MAMRSRLIVVFTLLCIAAALLLPAVPQSLEYHHFADRSDLWGIANFLDVASNLGFLIVGIAGLVIVFGGRAIRVRERAVALRRLFPRRTADRPGIGLEPAASRGSSGNAFGAITERVAEGVSPPR